MRAGAAAYRWGEKKGGCALRRRWRGAAFLLLLLLLALAPMAAGERVQGLRDRTRRPEPEWEGVLTVGVVASFPTVNLDAYLAAQGRAFAKETGYATVYLRPVTRAGVRAGAAAQSLPDALLFGLNVFAEPQTLFQALPGEYALRDGLSEAGLWQGTRYAVPLALGGYGLLGNRELLEKAGWTGGTAAEALALCDRAGLAVACPKAPYTDPLVALRQMGAPETAKIRGDLAHEKIWARFALDGEYALYAATQREVCRMETLRAGGSGVETVFLAPEGGAWTDQALLGAVVRSELTRAGAEESAGRAACARAFFEYLLGEEAQGALAQARLFPVVETGPLYEAGSAMADLEASLREGLRLGQSFAALDG